MAQPSAGGLDARRNNFDLLRLAAAAAVLVSHGYTLLGRKGPHLAIVDGDFGGVGVMIFFAISGFLVTRSFVLEPDVGVFARKRALRIFPALIAVVTLSAFVLGPIVTTLSTGGYLGAGHTWTYWLKNAFSYPLQETLPGVFAHLPHESTVNGSLWTLRYELLSYALVAAFGVASLLKGRRGWWLLVPIFVLAGSTFRWYVVAMFCVGALAYLHFDRIRLDPRILVGVLAFGEVFDLLGAARTSNLIVIPYVVLFAAFWRPLGETIVTRRGDVSYGVYLYAFPITQAMIKVLGDSTSPAVLILVTAVLTYGCATLSWRFIERPALRYKRRRVGSTAPAPV